MKWWTAKSTLISTARHFNYWDREEIKKARILITKKGTKSIIGREWLSTLKYKLISEQRGELEVNSIEKDQELSIETKQFVKETPKLFERRGKVKSHKVEINFKSDTKITQQKVRRIPFQLQKAVAEEIGRLLKEGNFEIINEMKDDVFIQP